MSAIWWFGIIATTWGILEAGWFGWQLHLAHRREQVLREQGQIAQELILALEREKARLSKENQTLRQANRKLDARAQALEEKSAWLAKHLSEMNQSVINELLRDQVTVLPFTKDGLRYATGAERVLSMALKHVAILGANDIMRRNARGHKLNKSASRSP